MFLWYAAGAVFAVFTVFQSSGLDYRLVAAGALVPLAVDLGFGEQAVGHSLVAPSALLAVVMLGTARRGYRLARRRLIGVPIGWYGGLALAGSWRFQEVFWWPAFGTELPGADLFAAWPVVVVEEVLGLLALRWIWVRFGLRDRGRRRTFWRTGRLSLAA